MHVFAFHRDDPQMLADWVQYHGHVVGLGNVHVVDHASADAEARDLLGALADRGGLRLYEYSGAFAQTPKGQGGKAAALTAVMRRVAQGEVARGRGDALLVPLDTDEFLVALGADGATRAGREAVRGAAELLDKSQSGRAGCWKLDMLTGLCPMGRPRALLGAEDGRPALGTEFTSAMLFSPNTTRLMSKSFFAASQFAQVDQGNHGCVTQNMSCRWDVVRASASGTGSHREWCGEEDVGFGSGLALIHHAAEPSWRNLARKIAGMAAAYDFPTRLRGGREAAPYAGPGADYLPVWASMTDDPAGGAKSSYREGCSLMRQRHGEGTSTHASLATLLRARAAPLEAILESLGARQHQVCCTCAASFPVAALAAPHDAVGRDVPPRNNPPAGNVCESVCVLCDPPRERNVDYD